MNSTIRTVLAAALLAATASTAQAQDATVSLSATRDASISVTTSTASLDIPSIVDGTTNSFGNVTITTDYSQSSGTVSLVGWFATPAQALANGTNYIPSSRVEGTLDGGTSWAAFTGAGVTGAGAAGGSLTLGSWTVPAGGESIERTTTLGLRLDLTGAKTVAGTYNGTLNLRAVVQ